MLFKLSVSNIRKSLRDYAIYFFTLIIGVSVFYVFNAIGTQASYLQVMSGRLDVVELLTSILSGVSGFVAVVLGLLIVYASRFLMKRRNKEFALYLILGMGKGKISAILLIETIIIGIGSLGVGLLTGIGLSQLMSALIVNLFEADMSAYKFTISSEAIGKTVLYFAIMYLVVMIFNSVIISRLKLIDLIQSGKKAENIKLKSPILCVLIFLISAIGLGYAYYQVGWKFNNTTMNQEKFFAMIIIGLVATFLIFWSVSGMLLRIVMSMKKMYYKNLNSFTFRQISSKINTTVMSMSVICLMLFITICALSSALSIRNSMNANLKELCPADFEIEYLEDSITTTENIAEVYANQGYDITAHVADYVNFYDYGDENFTLAAFFGDNLEAIKERHPMLAVFPTKPLVKLSDYNALMELYGREKFSLNDDEYIIICNYNSAKVEYDESLTTGYEITVFGHVLKSKYDTCQDGFIDIASQPLNDGIFIVPDNVIDENYKHSNYFIGNYNADSKEDKNNIEKIFIENYNSVARASAQAKDRESGFYISANTKIDISEATIGLGAIVTFLGLYIGLVFLISCGVILALKQLSDSVDSISRYTMLRKIGAEESDISKSLFAQTGIFFLLPLLLASIHSIFGMKFSIIILEVFGTTKLTESIFSTCIIILLIYGGYFLLTYFCSKNIIKTKN